MVGGRSFTILFASIFVLSCFLNYGNRLFSTAKKIRFIYFPKRNCATSVLISTFIYLWAIYIFPNSVHLFFRPRPIVEKSLTENMNVGIGNEAAQFSFLGILVFRIFGIVYSLQWVSRISSSRLLSSTHVTSRLQWVERNVCDLHGWAVCFLDVWWAAAGDGEEQLEAHEQDVSHGERILTLSATKKCISYDESYHLSEARSRVDWNENASFRFCNFTNLRFAFRHPRVSIFAKIIWIFPN